MLRLAKVQRLAPRLCLDPGKTCCDGQTVQAVILHRFEVLARFARSLQQTVVAEIQDLKGKAILESRDGRILAAVRHSLQTEAGTLPTPEREA